MRRRLSVLVALAPLALLAACGSNEPVAPDAAAATDAPGAAPESVPASGSTEAAQSADAATTDPADGAVPEILQFTAPLVGGGTFDATTVAGTPTVFWFWAPG